MIQPIALSTILIQLSFKRHQKLFHQTVNIPSDAFKPTVSRGAIPANNLKIQQDFGTVVQAKDNEPVSRHFYGEDFASIVLKGRTPVDYQQAVKNPFITNLAEMTLLDRYKPELEEALKTWLPFLKRSDLHSTSGDTLDFNVALDVGSYSASTKASHSFQFVKPTIGFRISDFSKEGVMVKPGLDLLTYRNQQNTEIGLSTGLAVNLKGQLYPDGEIWIKQGLVNSSTYFESKTYLDSYNQEVQFRIGLRHEIGKDHALGIYSRYIQPFSTGKQDFGLGLYFQKRF